MEYECPICSNRLHEYPKGSATLFTCPRCGFKVLTTKKLFPNCIRSNHNTGFSNKKDEESLTSLHEEKISDKLYAIFHEAKRKLEKIGLKIPPEVRCDVAERTYYDPFEKIIRINRQIIEDVVKGHSKDTRLNSILKAFLYDMMYHELSEASLWPLLGRGTSDIISTYIGHTLSGYISSKKAMKLARLISSVFSVDQAVQVVYDPLFHMTVDSLNDFTKNELTVLCALLLYKIKSESGL